MEWIFFLFAIPFFIFGTIFLTGKGASLLIGYHPNKKDDPKRANEKALLHFIGKLSITTGLGIVLIGAGELIGNRPLSVIAFIFVIGNAFFGTIYLLTDDRFRN